MLGEKWHESKVDPLLLLELQDLATVLSQLHNLQFKFSYGSFLDLEGRGISVSSLWDATEDTIRLAGYKTDLYLRALGTVHSTDIFDLNGLIDLSARNFSKQLFTLLEDLRLEEEIKGNRPGTVNAFTLRRDYLRQFFTSQLKMNIIRNYPADQLFCAVCLLLAAEGPDFHFDKVNPIIRKTLEGIKPFLYESFEARRTKEVLAIVENISHLLPEDLAKMNTIYFEFPVANIAENLRARTVFEELTRTDDLENKDVTDQESDSEYFDERLESWHQESAPTEKKQSFLQMDLEVGTKTNLKGKTARQTESGDQVFATAQGRARKSKEEDYAKFSSLEERAESFTAGKKDAAYGKDNMNARAIFKEAKPPTTNERLAYKKIQAEIEPDKRRLITSLEKILEQKRDSQRGNLHYGRLSKNLLPIVTEKFPRLFYKKDEVSKNFDAAFTLMVDCSASMNQKMPETKRGIALFHEVLKKLHIPHSIVGFWEGAKSTLKKDQPNYFNEIHTFQDSLYEDKGAKIMQLSPEEDNRDGFSVRIMTEQLLTRREKHKFLLVFTDGEPAADGYFENGIVDTNIAVSEARRKGLHVLGIFLSGGPITEGDRKMMRTIYGRDQLLISHLAELPERLSPILKKLLIKTI